jgi:hypothetical protein
MDTLGYNDNIRDHQAIGDDLGLLQRGILKGTITAKTPNAHFSGFELKGLLVAPQGTSYLKKDTVSTGGKRDGGANSRTTRRVIVRVNSADGTLVEDFALLWNHKDGFKELAKGFFKRAESMRNMQ